MIALRGYSSEQALHYEPAITEGTTHRSVYANDSDRSVLRRLALLYMQMIQIDPIRPF